MKTISEILFCIISHLGSVLVYPNLSSQCPRSEGMAVILAIGIVEKPPLTRFEPVTPQALAN